MPSASMVSTAARHGHGATIWKKRAKGAIAVEIVTVATTLTTGFAARLL